MTELAPAGPFWQAEPEHQDYLQNYPDGLHLPFPAARLDTAKREVTHEHGVHEVEIAIIGAGTAGMAAYHQARKQTDSIALIEGGPFGTTCARVGCMPSKLLVAPAHARHRLAALPAFGIESDAGKVDGRAVMKRVREERDRFVGFVKDSVESFDQRHVVRGHAVFEDPHTLRLGPASDGSKPAFERIRAKRIIIATGSRPRIPDSLRAAADRLIVNDDVFDWQDLPGSVAVFGAGAIGVEIGQALHRLGCSRASVRDLVAVLPESATLMCARWPFACSARKCRAAWMRATRGSNVMAM